MTNCDPPGKERSFSYFGNCCDKHRHIAVGKNNPEAFDHIILFSISLLTQSRQANWRFNLICEPIKLHFKLQQKFMFSSSIVTKVRFPPVKLIDSLNFRSQTWWHLHWTSSKYSWMGKSINWLRGQIKQAEISRTHAASTQTQSSQPDRQTDASICACQECF